MDTTVQLQVNVQNLVKRVMPAMLGNPVRALAELMQNARRAGASYVSFSIHGDGALVIEDDGCGLRDFQKILTAADSGWDEQTVQDEDPFGIGALVVFLSFNEFAIESLGNVMEGTHDDLTTFSPIRVTQGSYRKGVRIDLWGPRWKNLTKIEPVWLKNSLTYLAKGFPIDVIFDGTPLPRPDAVAAIDATNTPVGMVALTGKHEPDKNAPWVHGYGNRLYYQGLPLRDGDRSFGDANVVHINHGRFPARAPDREHLIEQAAFSDELEATIRTEWRTFLEEKKQTMEPNTFATTWWNHADAAGCLDLMNDIAFIPSCAIRGIDYLSCSEYDTMYAPFAKATPSISQGDIVTGKVVLSLPGSKQMEDANWAGLALAEHLGWRFIEPLPAGHWANRFVVDLDAAVVDVDYNKAVCADFSFNWVGGKVYVTPEIGISITEVCDGTLGRRFSASLKKTSIVLGEDRWDCTIVVGGESYGAEALVQACDYIDGDTQQVMDADREEEQGDMCTLVSSLRGETTARKSLEGYLSEMKDVKRRAMHGASCFVHFPEAWNLRDTPEVIELTQADLLRLVESKAELIPAELRISPRELVECVVRLFSGTQALPEQNQTA